MSSHPAGAQGPVACAMSPTTVMEPDSERRASMRNCMGERSCTSSTTMWPKARISSSDAVTVLVTGSGEAASPCGQNPISEAIPSSARLARVRAGRPRRGPEQGARLVDQGGVADRPLHRVERRAARPVEPLHRPPRCKIPLPAAVSSARAPRRSCRNSWADRRGHMRSRASADLGNPAQPLGQVLLLLGRRRLVRRRRRRSARAGPRYSSDRARRTWDSTKRRRALCVPGRRRAMPTMSSVNWARSRSTPAPKGPPRRGGAGAGGCAPPGPAP